MEAATEQELLNALNPSNAEAPTTLLPKAVTRAAEAVKSCASSILTEHGSGGCIENPGGEGEHDMVLGVETPTEGEACGVVKGVGEGKDEVVVTGGGGERDEVVVVGGDGGVGGGGCVLDGMESENGVGEDGEKEWEGPILTEGTV